MLHEAQEGARTGEYDELAGRLEILQMAGRLPDSALRPALAAGWASAVDQALDDGVLSENEEARLSSFVGSFDLTTAELNDGDAYSRFSLAKALRTILSGELYPADTWGHTPFNFQKSESLVWVFDHVNYFEEKVRREYVGGHSGASIRVMKGVYWRFGGFRGRPIQHRETVHADTGILGVTTKHLYFHGERESFRVRFDKIVSFEPYSDGIGIMKDGVRARPQVFQTGDGWFTYNLVTNVARGINE